MKTAIIFYSWSGRAKRLAEARAKKENAQLFEIKDKQRPGKLKAYTAGCFNALSMKRTPIQPFTAPLEEYDRIIIMSPVWAGHPAPAVNNIFDILPSGKKITVCMVSASGHSDSRAKIEALIKSRGCELAEFEDVKNS